MTKTGTVKFFNADKGYGDVAIFEVSGTYEGGTYLTFP